MADNELVDDFATATSQEKFMLMLVERVGGIEDKMHTMMRMMSDIYKFMTTKFLRGSITVPKGLNIIDAALLPRIVAAVQKNEFVVVQHAWVIVHPSVYPSVYSSELHTHVSVYLQLKENVIARLVTSSMNAHVVEDLGLKQSHAQAWESTDLDIVANVCKGGMSGKPVVYEQTFP